MARNIRRAARWVRRPVLAGLLFPLWLSAANLYQAGVPVSGTGVEERNQAIGQALKAVLVKLIGRRDNVEGEAVRALAAEAPNLVQQYRYETLPTAAGSGEAPERLLQVRFDSASLRQALRERGLPVWGGTRPSLLLWLGVEGRDGRRFVQADTDGDIIGAASAVSDKRGLSFLFPLLDMEDFSRLSPSDLWGGFDERITEASRRYGADLVLLGRLTATGSGWQGQWQLLGEARDNAAWRSSAANPEQAVEEGLQQAADRIAERYAPATLAAGGDQSLVLVRGVHGLEALKVVEQLFVSLDAVHRATLTRVEADRIWLRLSLAGTPDAVARGATLGGQLTLAAAVQPLPGPPPGPETAATIPDLVFDLHR